MNIQNEISMQNFPPPQISLANNPVQIGSIPINSNINNQQQYQCDTPPPIITKKPSPNCQEILVESRNGGNQEIKKADEPKQKSIESPEKNKNEIPTESNKVNNLNQFCYQQQNISYLQNPIKTNTSSNEQTIGMYSNALMTNKNLPQNLNSNSIDLNNNSLNDQIKISYNGVNFYNNNNNNNNINSSGMININNGILGYSQNNTTHNTTISPKIEGINAMTNKN